MAKLSRIIYNNKFPYSKRKYNFQPSEKVDTCEKVENARIRIMNMQLRLRFGDDCRKLKENIKKLTKSPYKKYNIVN